MKKFFMFFIALLMSSVTFAQDIVVIEDLATYQGSEPFVYNKKDGKVYAFNSLNEYEQWGLYTKVDNLKVASGSDLAIDYIAAVSGMEELPYINTGYTHTPETRVVVECVLLDSPDDGAYNWQAIFGARSCFGISHAFMFFNRAGSADPKDAGGYCVGGKEQWGSTALPHNEDIVIECQGHESNVYYADGFPGSPIINIYNDSEPTEGTCPMMIFTNNNVGTRTGSDTHYGSYSALMQLKSFKVYEGTSEEPVMDLRPYVFITGDAGLKDEITGKRFHAEEGAFEIPEGVDLNISGGISVYPGKRICYTVDNHEYKWDGMKWVDLGEMTTIPMECDVDYQNMIDNWTAPADKYACFGIARGNNAEGMATATYDPDTKTNDFPAYRGTGMHEPIGIQLPFEEGKTYRYSFDWGGATVDEYYSEALDDYIRDWHCSWNATTMRAGVLDKADLNSNGFTEPCTALGGGNGVLAFYKLPTQATLNDDGDVVASHHVQMEFVADQNGAYLLFPFGYVSDDVDFHFIIANLQVGEVVYPDLYNELNVTRPQLEVLIAEVEKFEGNTTDLLQQQLTEALEAAKKSLEGNDEAEHKAQVKALTEAYNAAKAVNIGNLRKTVAVAKAEGITKDIAEAEAFFVDGTDVNVSNTLLNNIRISRRILHQERQKDLFAGNEAIDGDFYIFNVGQQRFLQGGDDWGAHAALGYRGVELTLWNAMGGEGFEIETHLSNGDDSDWLNYGGYMDTREFDPWTFVEVPGKPGVYNIARVNVDEDFEGDYLLLGYRPGTWNRVDTDMQGVDDPNNQWKLVTAADREAALDQATADNFVDATYIISNPGFDQRDPLDAYYYQQDPATGVGVWGRGANYPDFVHECWNGGNANDYFEVSQDLVIPKDGWYLLSVQGYYRDGSIENQLNVLNEGGEMAKEASLILQQGAEVKEVLLKNIFDAGAVNKAPGYGYATEFGEVPNSCANAFQFFEVGCYWNSLKPMWLNAGDPCYFSVTKDTTAEGDWTVIDNFRLIYLGDAAEEPQNADGIADVVTEKTSAKAYNLQGMQVKNNTKQHGIYIINGRKVVR